MALFHLLVSPLIISDKDVLDLGSGCGDSTALLREMKPRSVRGVTAEKSQFEVSKKRFPRLDFVNSDAITYLSLMEKETVDCIIALDCVYHFSSRKQFLKHSFHTLRPGGHLALTDLILGNETTFLQRLLLRIICFLTSSPYANFKTQETYLKDYIAAGFVDLEAEDISDDVFLGLAGFIGRHRTTMTGFGIKASWGGYLGFRRVLEWWSKGVVRFVVVHAEKW